MDIRELNYLIAIYEEKSISRAAERLWMAQSSLSQFLKTMEVQIGSQLFFRTSTGVRTTEAGEIMIRFAYGMLSEYHRAQDEIQDLRNLESGRVMLGISTFRGTFLLPPILNAFRMKYPNIHVILTEKNSVELEQLLARGEIDLALVMLPLTKLQTFADYVMQDEICLITSSNHPIHGDTHPFEERIAEGLSHYVDVRDLVKYELILGDADTVLGRESRRIFREHGLAPTVRNETVSAFLAASMAASGLGVAFTYYCSHRFFSNAKYISLGKERIVFQLGIVLPPGRYHSRAALALRNTILEIFQTSK